jgi:ferrous iron transport protein A
MKEKTINIDKKHCLNELKINDVAEIDDINIKNERLKNRLFDMGFTKGVKVKIKKIAPLGDPVCIEIRGYEIGLRKEELKGIVVRDCK